MKVHVLHDSNGNIKALMAPGPGFGNVAMQPKRGEQVTVVEQPDLEGEQLLQKLAELNNQFRMDVSSGKLVQK
jgi:hypothetical protein